jgi:hypothetical protein
LAVSHWRESFRDLIVVMPALRTQGISLIVSTMISRKAADTKKKPRDAAFSDALAQSLREGLGQPACCDQPEPMPWPGLTRRAVLKSTWMAASEGSHDNND